VSVGHDENLSGAKVKAIAVPGNYAYVLGSKLE
jgi:hypothetical protein